MTTSNEPTWAGTSIPKRAIEEFRSMMVAATETLLDYVYDAAVGKTSKRSTKASAVVKRVDAAYALRDSLAREAVALGFPGLAIGVWYLVDGRIQTGRAEPKSLAAAVRKFITEYADRHNQHAERVESDRVKKLIDEINQVPIRGSAGPLVVDSHMRPVNELAAATSVDDETPFHTDITSRDVIASGGMYPVGELDARTMSPTSAHRPEKASGPRLAEVDTVAALLRAAPLFNQAASRVQHAGRHDDETILVQAALDLRTIASGTMGTSEVPTIITAVQGVADRLRDVNPQTAANLDLALADLAAGSTGDAVTNAERIHGSVDA